MPASRFSFDLFDHKAPKLVSLLAVFFEIIDMINEETFDSVADNTPATTSESPPYQ